MYKNLLPVTFLLSHSIADYLCIQNGQHIDGGGGNLNQGTEGYN